MKESIAESFRAEKVEWNQLKVSKEALKKVTLDLANRYSIFPLRLDKGSLEIAVSETVDLDSIDTLSHYLGLHLKPKWSSKEAIHTAIATYYYDNNHSLNLSQKDKSVEASSFEGIQDKRKDRDNVSLNDYFSHLIDKAVNDRASDIHIEPLARQLRVRFRIDGILREIEHLPLVLSAAITNQIKLQGQLDIAEKRLPQDGRIRIRKENISLDLRLSSSPTVYGESIVMRLLKPEDLKKDFVELGLDDRQKQDLQKMMQAPNGLILFTGPTGSGKTTTLYTCLQKLNQANRKIITLEDPIEYEIRGVNQVHIQWETGMTFAKALRAILRQSPDVIMIGEIRDEETAKIAVNASLTGHLVISTLHTNDASSAITRLMEMNVHPFLLAAGLRAVIAQRLVPMLCRYCQVMPCLSISTMDLFAKQRLNDSGELKQERLKRVEGCPHCMGSGYYGRTGIFEILPIKERLQSLIHEGASLEKIRSQMLHLGMKTLRKSGTEKVAAGLTSMEAVRRTTLTNNHLEE